MQNHKKRVRIFINILLVIVIVLFLYSGYHVWDIISTYKDNEKLQNKLQTVFYMDESELLQILPNEESMKNESVKTVVYENPLQSIQEINKEVNAWIQMDDTVIDYPVVQGKDNDYYLNHDLYGESTVCGSIFMDYRCVLGNPMENIILYGHRMNDDSMFGELIRFTERDFMETHPSFAFITENVVYRCDIFAVYKTTTDFEYYRIRFGSQGDFLEYVDQCKNESIYDFDIDISAEDTVLTLSTCDDTLDPNKGRLVIQAKMVPVTILE